MQSSINTRPVGRYVSDVVVYPLQIWAIWNYLPVAAFSSYEDPPPKIYQTSDQTKATSHICMYENVCIYIQTHREICMQVKKLQLELDMEQWTGS